MKNIWLAAMLILAGGAGWAGAEGSDGVRSLGLGLNWAHQQLGGSLNDQNPGGVTARYWFNERWGADVGVGTGFPDTSANSIFLVNFSAEGMRTIKRSGSSVFYADLLVMPALAQIHGGLVNNVLVDNGQNGKAFALSISAGLGFETALSDMPRVRWFLQLNPLSYEHVAPATGSTVKGSKAVDLLGSNMVVSLGFHYQL